jgi:DNA-binding transcriptional regulator YiaG
MTHTEIKTLRKSLSLSTSDFGARVGVSGRTVEQWEQGRRTPGGAAEILLYHLTAESQPPDSPLEPAHRESHSAAGRS